jgi:hypothetical protein
MGQIDKSSEKLCGQETTVIEVKRYQISRTKQFGRCRDMSLDLGVHEL